MTRLPFLSFLVFSALVAAASDASAQGKCTASGQMAGQYPKSPWKIAFLVLLAIIAFFIFVMLSQNN